MYSNRQSIANNSLASAHLSLVDIGPFHDDGPYVDELLALSFCGSFRFRNFFVGRCYSDKVVLQNSGGDHHPLDSRSFDLQPFNSARKIVHLFWPPSAFSSLLIRSSS